jgi:hypothetical protein
MGTGAEEKKMDSPSGEPEEIEETEEEAASGRIKWLVAEDVRLFRDDAGHVRATVRGDRSIVRPALLRAFPISAPDRLIELREESGDSVGMLRDLAGLDDESQQLAESILHERYLVPVVSEVVSLRRETGMWVWEVVTNRGERTFTMKSPRDDIRRLPGGCLRITDVDGNTFEVSSLQALDQSSRQLIDKIV